ncbi:hypothetical protein SAMN05443254_101102 [Bradyrhizobium sp. OK095]|nr:hypothetical protein SAMN05443254_101102 [Bradyrhizobium sp. OK095]
MAPDCSLSVRQAINKRPAVEHHSHGSLLAVNGPCTANNPVAFGRFVMTNRFSSGARSTKIMSKTV